MKKIHAHMLGLALGLLSAPTGPQAGRVELAGQSGRAMLTTGTLAASGDPPTEFRIWAYGDIGTSIGQFSLTKEDATAMVNAWAAWGNDLHFDYEHAAFNDNLKSQGDAPAAGWYKLEAREDGLWATNIEWTEKAFQRIKDKELRYYSPAFLAIDGRIVELMNIALTNYPATNELEPLVASRVLASRGMTQADGKTGKPVKLSMDSKTKDSRDGIQLTSLAIDSIYSKLSAILEDKLGYQAYLVEVFNDYAVFRMGADTYRIEYTITDSDLSVTSEPVEVEKTYIPIEGGKTMNTLLVTLGLAANASEAEAVAVANRLNAGTAQLLSLTGAKTVEEATGTLAAWKASHDRLQSVEAENAKRAEDAAAAEKASLITTGMAEGKIPPAQKDFWEGQPLEALKGFLTSALPNPATVKATASTTPAGNGSTPAAGSNVATELASMSPEALAVAKLMGHKPEDVAAHMAARHSRQA